MSTIRLMPILLFFLTLTSVQSLFAPDHTYARSHYCCLCGDCHEGCTCGCDCLIQGCLQEALLGNQEFVLIQTDKVKDVRLIAEADVVGQFKQLKRGNCGTFTIRLVGDAEKGLKLKCTAFKKLEKGGAVSDDVKKMTREFEKVSPMKSDRKSGKHSEEETKQ